MLNHIACLIKNTFPLHRLKPTWPSIQKSNANSSSDSKNKNTKNHNIIATQIEKNDINKDKETSCSMRHHKDCIFTVVAKSF